MLEPLQVVMGSFTDARAFLCALVKALERWQCKATRYVSRNMQQHALVSPWISHGCEPGAACLCRLGVGISARKVRSTLAMTDRVRHSSSRCCLQRY